MNSFKFGHTQIHKHKWYYIAGIRNDNARHHSPITAHDTFHTEAKTGEAL